MAYISVAKSDSKFRRKAKGGKNTEWSHLMRLLTDVWQLTEKANCPAHKVIWESWAKQQMFVTRALKIHALFYIVHTGVCVHKKSSYFYEVVPPVV